MLGILLACLIMTGPTECSAGGFSAAGVIEMTTEAISFEITNLASGAPEADIAARDLASRHAVLLDDALEAAGGGLAHPVRIAVVSLPAFQDSENATVRWPPDHTILTSPWISFGPLPSGGTQITLLVSDLRIIADFDLMARNAPAPDFELGDGLRSIPFRCLSQSAEAYVALVSGDRQPDAAAIRAGCVAEPIAPHLLALFQRSPQVFFAPFDMAVLDRVATERRETETVYRQLYTALVRSAVAALNSGKTAPADPAWWHGALTAIHE